MKPANYALPQAKYLLELQKHTFKPKKEEVINVDCESVSTDEPYNDFQFFKKPISISSDEMVDENNPEERKTHSNCEVK